MRQGHAQTRQGHAQAREGHHEVCRQRAVLSHELDTERIARQIDKKTFLRSYEGVGLELGQVTGRCVPDLFSTTFGEHIEDEGICEETSWEPLGNPLCGKTLGPILIRL